MEQLYEAEHGRSEEEKEQRDTETLKFIDKTNRFENKVFGAGAILATGDISCDLGLDPVYEDAWNGFRCQGRWKPRVKSIVMRMGDVRVRVLQACLCSSSANKIYHVIWSI